MAKLLGGTTVYGLLSATGVMYASGGNSNNWNSVYSLVNTSTATTFNVNNLTTTGSVGIKQTPLYFDADVATVGNSYGDLGLGSSNNIIINPNSNLILTQNIGSVGIGTSVPNQKLTVVGNISGTAVIYASSGNSNQWNTAYSVVTAYPSTSSVFITNTVVNNLTGLLTPLATTNALTSLLTPLTLTNTLSSLLTPLTLTNTLTSQLLLTTIYQNASSNWQNTYTTFSSNSGALTTVVSNSANWNTAYQSVSSQPYTLVDATSSIQPKRGLNTASGSYTGVVGGRCNTASGRYSIIDGGYGNFNPLRSSVIGGGDFNHTGGYCAIPITNTSNPTNFATAALSGNGSCTLMNFGCASWNSCFSTAGTNAMSIVYTTSGVPLSAGNFAVANIISQPNTCCIIVGGDFSVNQASSASLSATCVFIYDRLLNQGGFHSTVGGGKLNTASGQYDTVVGGKWNSAIGNCSFVGGGFRNYAQSCAAVVGGGCQNTASGQYASILGGIGNTAVGRTAGVGAGASNCANGNCSFIGGGISNNTGTGSTSFIGGGNTNIACGVSTNIVGGQSNTITVAGDCSVIGGGRGNRADAVFTFIAGGSANDTKGFANTFILGTGLSASAVNFTYVNNLSSQGVVVANPLRVGNAITSTTVTTIVKTIEVFDVSGISLGYIPVYSTRG